MEQAGKRRQFDAAFKAGRPLGRTVRMVTEGGYTQAEVAQQLGIEAKRINHWIKQMQQHDTKERAFPGQGHEHQGHEHDPELARLRREVAILRMERNL